MSSLERRPFRLSFKKAPLHNLGEVSQPGRWDVPEISLGEVSTEPRFLSSVESSVRSFALQFINDQLRRTQQADSASRNLILFLTTAAGWPEMRTTATQRLEGWLQNPKVGTPISGQC